MKQLLIRALVLFPLTLVPCPGTALAGTEPQPPDSAEVDQHVAGIVADWDKLPSIFDDIDVYARQIRDLVQIGKPAVPALTAALDRTTNDAPLRLLAFTLRAIGDARAVPALIRALPRTLLPPGSDCAMPVADPGLLQFMLAHDLHDEAGNNRMARRNFDMGRPVREVSTALRKITGTRLDESEIFMTFLDGGAQQRTAEQRQYYLVAQHWAGWWNTNWSRWVDDPSLADARLNIPKLETVSNRFLTGPDVKTSEGEEGVILTPIEEKGRRCGLTLILNRMVDFPRSLAESQASAVTPESLSAWAARAGVDLLGTRYDDSSSGKTYYCLRGVGLQAWEIPNDRWATIAQDLQHDRPPALDAPAGDLLMHYDTDQGRYVPEKRATFLFITREGLQGVLRVVAQVTRLWTPRDMGIPMMRTDENSPDQVQDSGPELGVKLEYKLFYVETAEMRAQEKARRQAAAERDETRQKRKMANLLEKYPHLTGHVVLPNGESAGSNATVLLGVPQEAEILGDRDFELAKQSTIVHTLEDGSFVLPHVPRAHAIYVAHDQGFGELSLDRVQPPFKIRLAPWGRIEGILTLNGKPAAHQKMSLLRAALDPGVSSLSLSPNAFSTESDEQGKYVFSNVPPGEVQVCRMVHNVYCEGQSVHVSAGALTVFHHGFNGRPVKGHFVTSDSSKDPLWNGGRGFRFSTKSAPLKPPAGQDPRTWTQNYWQSAEGRERQRTNYLFAMVVDAQGNFLIEDVPPGTYQLSGELHDGPANGLWFAGKTLGRINQEVIVPEREPGRPNEPLDLGSLVVQMVRNLKPGDTAPDFQIETIDGASLHLEDFRGKYVLLDFWATWCAPCRAETPHLKAVYDTFGSDARFAMIGLSLDPAAEAPKDYSRKQALRWHQGFLGDWPKASLPAQYGVEGIPAIFLLDPAGKIIATDLRGAEIQNAVAKVLDETKR